EENLRSAFLLVRRRYLDRQLQFFARLFPKRGIQKGLSPSEVDLGLQWLILGFAHDLERLRKKRGLVTMGRSQSRTFCGAHKETQRSLSLARPEGVISKLIKITFQLAACRLLKPVGTQRMQSFPLRPRKRLVSNLQDEIMFEAKLPLAR